MSCCSAVERERSRVTGMAGLSDNSTSMARPPVGSERWGMGEPMVPLVTMVDMMCRTCRRCDTWPLLSVNLLTDVVVRLVARNLFSSPTIERGSTVRFQCGT
jgi:hypothetical protein